MTEAFALATERAVKADFDGVELHGAHGFLLNQFFSPLLNRRTDNYGDSLENRMRFPLEVIGRVRKKLGWKILSYRLDAVNLNSSGVDIEDSKKFAVKMEEAGVDIILFQEVSVEQVQHPFKLDRATLSLMLIK